MQYDITIGGPNRVVAGTLSGGSYLTDLPLSNAENTELGAVARTVDCALASTKFVVDLGQARNVLIVAIVGTNVSSAAQIRISGGTSSGGSQVYAGSWIPAWTLSTVDSALAAMGLEHSSGLALQRGQYPIGICLTALKSARYWAFEIDDQVNADGFVEFSRVYVAGALMAQFGVRPGVTGAMRDLSGVGESEGGADWSYLRARQRKEAVQLVMPPEQGQLANELRSALGITQELMYVASRTDREVFQRGSFLARFEEVPAWEFPYAAAHSFQARLVERI